MSKEYIPNDLIDNIPVWDNHPRPVEGLPPFGYYDNDIQFQSDAPRIAKYVAYKLGYPLVDVELQDINIYTCFEDAIYTYTSELNKYKIRENLLRIKGASTSQDLTNKQVKSGLGSIIRLAKEYGSEAGSGGTITYHKGYIDLILNKQTYNLNEWAELNVPGKSIEIKKVYHEAPPAISRYFDPYVGTGVGTNYMMSEFGWDKMSPAVSFVMMPIYEDLLRLQAIEFNMTVRKSAYTFKLVNNQLTLFPYPITDVSRVYFDYIIIEDRDSVVNNNDDGNTITDYSNAPYGIIQYSKINQPGKEWIRELTFACSKILLGEIRGKYSSIPIPDSEVSLNGDSLKSEGMELRQNLIEQLREQLEQMMNVNQLEVIQRENESITGILNTIPHFIYTR